jgi:hypothetical protein
MTEERKHAILFAATLLVARKLMPLLDREEGRQQGPPLAEGWESRARKTARPFRALTPSKSRPGSTVRLGC